MVSIIELCQVNAAVKCDCVSGWGSAHTHTKNGWNSGHQLFWYAYLIPLIFQCWNQMLCRYKLRFLIHDFRATQRIIRMPVSSHSSTLIELIAVMQFLFLVFFPSPFSFVCIYIIQWSEKKSCSFSCMKRVYVRRIRHRYFCQRRA